MRSVGGPGIFVAAGLMRGGDFGFVCRTLQKSHDSESGEDRHSEKCGRLPSRKRLGPPHEIFKVAGPDGVRHTFDLRCRLPDKTAGDGKVAVEFLGRATDGAGEAPDIVRARALLAIDGLFKLIGCLRCDILGGIDEFRSLVLDCLRRCRREAECLILDVAAGGNRLVVTLLAEVAAFLNP